MYLGQDLVSLTIKLKICLRIEFELLSKEIERVNINKKLLVSWLKNLEENNINIVLFLIFFSPVSFNEFPISSKRVFNHFQTSSQQGTYLFYSPTPKTLYLRKKIYKLLKTVFFKAYCIQRMLYTVVWCIQYFYSTQQTGLNLYAWKYTIFIVKELNLCCLLLIIFEKRSRRTFFFFCNINLTV